VEELAKETLDVLNQQRQFFATKARNELMRAKAMERALRMKCEEILKPFPAGLREPNDER
jgi:hypothetical protein